MRRETYTGKVGFSFVVLFLLLSFVCFVLGVFVCFLRGDFERECQSEGKASMVLQWLCEQQELQCWLLFSAI